MLRGIRARYPAVGAADAVVHATGDLLTPVTIDEVLSCEVWMI